MMLKRLPLPWRWFFGLASLLAALLLVVDLSINLILPSFLTDIIRQDLARNVKLTRDFFAPRLAAIPASVVEINVLARRLSGDTGLRVTIMASDGTVVGESNVPADQVKNMENHLFRPEVQIAKVKGLGSATRRSDTINVDLLYVAAAVQALNTTNLIGFVRVALPLHQVNETIACVRHTVITASVIVGLLAMPVLLWIARRATVPVMQMREVAGRVARGDFSKRASTRVGNELGELATALNDMSEQLDARLRELTQEKAGLSAILSSMTEGVLVIDGGGNIRLANEALRPLLDISEDVTGKTALEVFRNVHLQEIVVEVAQTNRISSRELTFLSPVERVFLVNAARLQVRDGISAGVVVVFHDITRLKQLENLRKEFVANVSHELRTPLSIIKGYIETLLDPHPPDAVTTQQFLQTIQRHSQRLETLIGDLLTVSALESQSARLQLEPVSLRELATTAAGELAGEARKKSMTITVEIPPEFPQMRVDVQRMHQVFFNLIENAVKYVPAGGRVAISAKLTDGEVEVCVADNGSGIGAEHLPRIFERFYRVDKARSRELGGTGLGLSIVKHIVQAHGGHVWAESEVGKGSAFFFTLPRT